MTPWTLLRDDFLRAAWNERPVSEIAEALDVSAEDVIDRARELGLPPLAEGMGR